MCEKTGIVLQLIKKNHLVGDCRSGNCTICKKRHHTLLHIDSKVCTVTDENRQSNNKTSITNLHI